MACIHAKGKKARATQRATRAGVCLVNRFAFYFFCAGGLFLVCVNCRCCWFLVSLFRKILLYVLVGPLLFVVWVVEGWPFFCSQPPRPGCPFRYPCVSLPSPSLRNLLPCMRARTSGFPSPSARICLSLAFAFAFLFVLGPVAASWVIVVHLVIGFQTPPPADFALKRRFVPRDCVQSSTERLRVLYCGRRGFHHNSLTGLAPSLLSSISVPISLPPPPPSSRRRARCQDAS